MCPCPGDNRPEQAILAAHVLAPWLAHTDRELLSQHEVLHQEILARAQRPSNPTMIPAWRRMTYPPAGHHAAYRSRDLGGIEFCTPTTPTQLPKREVLLIFGDLRANGAFEKYNSTGLVE